MNKRAKTFTKRCFLALGAAALAVAIVLSGIPALMNAAAAEVSGIKAGHFTSDFATLEEAHEVAAKLNIQMMSEGMVLMKNKNNVLPLKPEENGITLMGAPSYDVVSGGMGSGAGAGIEVTLQQSFIDAGYRVNRIMEQTYADLPAELYRGEVSAGVRAYKTSTIQEDPVHIKSAEYSIDGLNEKYKTVVWTLSRVGCEGSDGFTSNIPINADPNKHYLELNDGEEKMLAYLSELKAANKIDKVIVLINSANVMEMASLEDSDTVDGIFWLGQPGPNGLAAVGKLFNGEANPSGKTVDIWNANHKADPTWQNFGDNSQHDIWVQDATTKKWSKKADQELHDFYMYSGNMKDADAHSIEYEEDIYLGYKWYETAAYENVLKNCPFYKAPAQGVEDYYNRGNGVIYPFGYGLSYTTFSQKFVTEATDLAASINGKATYGKANLDECVEVKVEVTNTGDVAGKEVVQLYVNAPYTKPTGADTAIEKAYVQLVSFAKTGLLEAGESETVSLRVRLADLAAFDYNDANGNDYKGYELEKGPYNFRIQKNSHESFAELSCDLEAIKLDNDNDASNNTPFSMGDDYDTLLIKKAEGTHSTMKLLSRKDLAGTFPSVTTKAERDYGKRVHDLLHNGTNKDTAGKLTGDKAYGRYVENMNSSDDQTGDPWFKTNADIPAGWTQAADETGRTNGKTAVQIYEMSGLDYTSDALLTEDDPFYSATEQRTQKDAWIQFMNQLTVDEMKSLLRTGSFQTPGLASVGRNQAKDADGPAQLGKSEGGYTFCCEVNIASTWNVELAYARGYMTGHDSLFLGITGWYAPAMNIHRSPFGGRNFEYYSQDALLGGFMGAADVAGFRSKGGISFMKHYVLNDQETGRGDMGTWVSEQAARENYFKNFEYAVKEFQENIKVTIGNFTITADKIGGSLGIMTSYNRVGAIKAFVNYHTKQTLARDEWGFKGHITSDLGSGVGNMLMRTGGSNHLGTLSGYNVITGDWDASLRDGKGNMRDGNVGTDGKAPESATQYYALRMSAMQILYAGANANVTKNGADLSLLADKTIEIQEGAALNEDLSSSFGNLGSVITYTATSKLPAGVTLSAAGKVEGRPTTVGEYKIDVQLKTQQWITAKTQITLKVTPLLSSTEVKDGKITAEVGKKFTTKFTQDVFHLNDKYTESYHAFKDEVARITKITYQLRTEVPGLTMKDDGTLSGTPTAGGTYDVVVRTVVNYPSDRGANQTANFDTTFTLEVAGGGEVLPPDDPLDQFQVRVTDAGMIQISNDYGRTWTDVIDKSELKGDQGAPGEKGGGCNGSIGSSLLATLLVLLCTGGAVLIARAAKKRNK